MFNRQSGAQGAQPLSHSPSQAAIAAASPIPDGGATIKLLYGSITGPGGQQLTEIRFRAPKAGDWIEIGDFQIAKQRRNDDGSLEFIFQMDPKAAGAWCQRLSGIPLSMLNQLDYRDFKRVFHALLELVGGDTSGN